VEATDRNRQTGKGFDIAHHRVRWWRRKGLAISNTSILAGYPRFGRQFI
jgi:hypothetical protein